MSDTKFYLNVARALQICLVLTIWPTNSAVDVCEEIQYWDAIQERCSACEGICRVYDRTIHKDCQYICFQDSREYRQSPDLNPSELATKSELLQHYTWLIALTVCLVVVVGILSIPFVILWHKCKKSAIMQGAPDEAGLLLLIDKRIEDKIRLNPNLNPSSDGGDHAVGLSSYLPGFPPYTGNAKSSYTCGAVPDVAREEPEPNASSHLIDQPGINLEPIVRRDNSTARHT